MIRDTSQEAYASIQPLLSDCQREVLARLKADAPLTNAELAAKLGWTINRVTPRTGELVKLGFVKDVGKRPCGVTGRSAHTWAATDYIAPEKPKTRIEYVNIGGVMHARVVTD